jgi:hypothetical protein
VFYVVFIVEDDGAEDKGQGDTTVVVPLISRFLMSNLFAFLKNDLFTH